MLTYGNISSELEEDIMRIILLRSTAVMPDPPVEKMANALITLGHKVKILAWDRDNIYRERTSRKRMTNG